ncbi:DUF6559 family protein [Colwellia sp. MB3u-70]|uniref:DUF6559 family protein n=1 Tax=Colwellia sp. MB3u-70 TaxID=2759819 RepID=UPI0028705C5A|nr:DUF6559 family protein [Colwellia sp. MB3u-70]
MVTSIPRQLLSKFDMKNSFSPEEVKRVFVDALGNDINIKYAFAMFCSQVDFNELSETHQFGSTFSELRLEVSKKCFEGWPRFNFESLLSYSKQSTMSGLVNEVTDIGLDFGCGD